MIMRRVHLAVFCVGVAAFVGLIASTAMAQEEFSPYIDDQGTTSFPDGFRTSMVHLGSWFVPEGDASGLHDVFTEKLWKQTAIPASFLTAPYS